MEEKSNLKMVAGLLDSDGRVVRYPSKLKKRVYATLYLAEKFQTGRTYTELEVNACIRQWIAFEDYVLVRRDLVDYGCLIRTPDCKIYRRADDLPGIEQII